VSDARASCVAALRDVVAVGVASVVSEVVVVVLGRYTSGMLSLPSRAGRVLDDRSLSTIIVRPVVLVCHTLF